MASNTPTDEADASPTSAHTTRQGLAGLTLAAIGVVYGDIGTSPLYTVKEVFSPHTGLSVSPDNVLGAVSTIVWALMLVVTLKYVILILRADNNGEGGGLALTALAAKAVGSTRPRLRQALTLLGVFGATLFYGDSLITPAISVMGAMEGLEYVTPAAHDWVVPCTLVVLLGLFVVQRFGTALVGRFFGPIIVLWFVVLSVVGLWQIAQQPAVVAALNPLHAWEFLSQRGWKLLAVIGAVVLALTGAEALYADMGHFGKRPIRLAWGGLVLCPHWPSTTWARGHCCWAMPPPWKTPSTACSLPHWRYRCCCWPRWQPSLHRRP